MLRAFKFLLILLMLAGLAMLSAITTMHFAIHGAEVTVPSFKGLTVPQATEKALSMGLNVSVENRFYSIDTPAEHIAGQSPAPGTVVRRDWHVRLIESLGPQRVAIPNVTGLDQRVASIQIRRDGLEIGATASMPWPYAPVSSVIAQNPAPGAADVARPSVSLLFAAPLITTAPAFVMPNFTGQMLPAASQVITQVGLTLAPVITVPVPIPAVSANPTQPMPPLTPSGSIIRQNPQPGQRVDSSTTIQLTVVQ